MCYLDKSKNLTASDQCLLDFVQKKTIEEGGLKPGLKLVSIYVSLCPENVYREIKI